MQKTVQETVDFCQRFKEDLAKDGDCSASLRDGRLEVAVAPPFTALSAANQALKGSPVFVSAQNSFWAESGAYTGEISPKMLVDVGCRFAIIGHSERRQFFQETDEGVNKKAAALLKAGIIPIVCLGETLAERKEGRAFSVAEKQLRAGLKELTVKGPRDFVIAYEPVWAIGTGQTATPEQAEEIHAFLRKLLAEIFSPAIALAARILYGGSVKPDNTAELMAMGDIDGALVGGASLEVKSFFQIVKGSLRRG